MAKKIISYLISFLLVIFIILSLLITVTDTTILRKEYVLSELENGNYYERINGDIKDNFINYTVQTGFDEDEVIKDLYTEEKLKSDINQMVNSIYGGNKINIETASIKTALENNINKELDKENKKISSSEQSSVEKYIETMQETYKNSVVYSEKTIQKIGEGFSRIIKIVSKVKIIVYSITAVIAIIILLMNLKKARFIKYIGIALISSGIIFILPKVITEAKMSINHIMIINQATSNLIQTIVTDIVGKIMTYGIIMVIIGIIIIIIQNILEANNKEERRSSKH